MYQLIVYTTSEASKHKQMQKWKENTSKRCDHAHGLITRLGEIPSGNKHIDLIAALLFWNRLAFLWLWWRFWLLQLCSSEVPIMGKGVINAMLENLLFLKNISVMSWDRWWRESNSDFIRVSSPDWIWGLEAHVHSSWGLQGKTVTYLAFLEESACFGYALAWPVNTWEEQSISRWRLPKQKPKWGAAVVSESMRNVPAVSCLKSLALGMCTLPRLQRGTICFPFCLTEDQSFLRFHTGPLLFY